MDVTSAYLHVYLVEYIYIYMEKPELLLGALSDIVGETQEEKQIRKKATSLIQKLKKNKDAVCHLKKAIYRLRQAGKQWYQRLCKKLKDVNLQPTVADRSVSCPLSSTSFVPSVS